MSIVCGDKWVSLSYMYVYVMNDMFLQICIRMIICILCRYGGHVPGNLCTFGCLVKSSQHGFNYHLPSNLEVFNIPRISTVEANFWKDVDFASSWTILDVRVLIAIERKRESCDGLKRKSDFNSYFLLRMFVLGFIMYHLHSEDIFCKIMVNPC